MEKTNIIVKSKLREILKENECSLGGDYVDKLEENLNALISRSIERAKANGRKTVSERDL